MRPIFLAAAALTASLLVSAPVSAFELDSPDPVGGFGGSNFDFDVDGGGPKGGTVLERFADSNDKNKEGKLQVFGDNLGGSYGLPGYIPGPGRDTPSWYYSTPSFRAAR